MSRAVTLYTIGHGARPLDAFLGLLEGAAVGRLVDVRTAPGSRKHPQFGGDALAEALEERGIGYVWRKELGGWRKARPDSRHPALRSAGFRGYADHMETTEFRDVRDWLLRTSQDFPTAVMCAESLWWRCHRRMLADALTAAGAEVWHLMEGGRRDRHRLHPAARLEGDLPVYDVAPAEAGQAGPVREQGPGRADPGPGGQARLDIMTPGDGGTGSPAARQERPDRPRSASAKASNGSSRSARTSTRPS